jgi:hypothetical protein
VNHVSHRLYRHENQEGFDSDDYEHSSDEEDEHHEADSVHDYPDLVEEPDYMVTDEEPDCGDLNQEPYWPDVLEEQESGHPSLGALSIIRGQTTCTFLRKKIMGELATCAGLTLDQKVCDRISLHIETRYFKANNHSLFNDHTIVLIIPFMPSYRVYSNLANASSYAKASVIRACWSM